jgi:phospholipid/cholesterol/gamma-HCH transport system permease protein
LIPGLGPINTFLEWFGDLAIFSWHSLRAAVTPPFEFRELFRQLDEIGSMSLPLVAAAGAAIGAVLSLEARYSLTRFGAKSMLPAAIVYSVIHETGPIITGLIVSGRVGAGIGAELASMKVTEQIDAIEASAVNPYKLLVVTRILACILMLPLLTLAADFCGVLAGWITQAIAEPLSLQQFINSAFKGTTLNDFLPPTFKTAGRRCGRGPGRNQFRSPVLLVCHPGRCCPGEIHSYLFPVDQKANKPRTIYGNSLCKRDDPRKCRERRQYSRYLCSRPA